MTVEILKRGQPPVEQTLERTCRHCGTEFRFQRADCTLHIDRRDGDYLEINCPVCAKSLTYAA